MLWLFRRIVSRLQALLVADAALDLEAEFLSRHADRKADLLRKADEYAEQGLDALAEELRRQTEKLSEERPLASVLPILGDIAGEATEADLPRLEGSPSAPTALTTNSSPNKMAQPKVTRKAKRR